jgi:hypothetical protein
MLASTLRASRRQVLAPLVGNAGRALSTGKVDGDTLTIEVNPYKVPRENPNAGARPERAPARVCFAAARCGPQIRLGLNACCAAAGKCRREVPPPLLSAHPPAPPCPAPPGAQHRAALEHRGH